jgi:hypothetical protein
MAAVSVDGNGSVARSSARVNSLSEVETARFASADLHHDKGLQEVMKNHSAWH